MLTHHEVQGAFSDEIASVRCIGSSRSSGGPCREAQPKTFECRPAVGLTARLLDGGADVRAHDPAAGQSAPRALPDLVMSTAEEADRGADAAVIATDWPMFRDLPRADLLQAMRRR